MLNIILLLHSVTNTGLKKRQTTTQNCQGIRLTKIAHYHIHESEREDEKLKEALMLNEHRVFVTIIQMRFWSVCVCVCVCTHR